MIVLVGSGCARTQPDIRVIMNGKQYLALGDSYTIGQSVAESARWPVQLAAKLREQGIAVPNPRIIAHTGWTTADLAAEMPDVANGETFDLVTLLIGTNDEFQGHTADEYRQGFSSLLQQSIALARGNPTHVIVLSIPDWGTTPFAAGQDRAAIAAAIDRFNVINQEETTRLGAQYVDIITTTRAAANDPESFARDGLHYSAQMYARWAELAIPAASQALGKNP